MIKLNAKEIFGKDSVYFDLKQELTSKSGITSIPDGYVISLEKPYSWFIVEGELSSHQVYDHIVKQLTKFMTGIENPTSQREVMDVLYNKIREDKLLKAYIETAIGSEEIHHFLSKMLSNTPRIVVIIEQVNEEVKEACQALKYNTEIIEFKTYVREDAPNIHAYIFESLAPIKREKPPTQPTPSRELITPQSAYTIPILESIIELGGKAKSQDILAKVHEKIKPILKDKDYEKIPSGGEVRWRNQARWHRLSLKKEGYLNRDTERGTWEITEEGRKTYENLKPKFSLTEFTRSQDRRPPP